MSRRRQRARAPERVREKVIWESWRQSVSLLVLCLHLLACIPGNLCFARARWQRFSTAPAKLNRILGCGFLLGVYLQATWSCADRLTVQRPIPKEKQRRHSCHKTRENNLEDRRPRRIAAVRSGAHSRSLKLRASKRTTRPMTSQSPGRQGSCGKSGFSDVRYHSRRSYLRRFTTGSPLKFSANTLPFTRFLSVTFTTTTSPSNISGRMLSP